MNKMVITFIILLISTMQANCYTVLVPTRTIPNYRYGTSSYIASCLNNGGGHACYIKNCLKNNGGNACYSKYKSYRTNKGNHHGR